MSSKSVMKAMIGFYVFLFFLYLFGPLMVMSVTAFNTPNYPTAFPFEGFTLEAYASETGVVKSASLTMPVERGLIKWVVAGAAGIAKLFTKEQ